MRKLNNHRSTPLKDCYIPEWMYAGTLNQLPGGYLQNYLNRIASSWPSGTTGLQASPHLVVHDLSVLLSTTNPNEQTLLSYGLWDLYPRTSPAPIPFIYNQCKFFQNNSHLPSPNLRFRGTHQLQDGIRICLFHAALLLAVQAEIPRPGPLLASIQPWPFVSEELLTVQIFLLFV